MEQDALPEVTKNHGNRASQGCGFMAQSISIEGVHHQGLAPAEPGTLQTVVWPPTDKSRARAGRVLPVTRLE